MDLKDINSLKEFADTMKKQLADLTPQLSETMKMVQDMPKPKLIKDCKINGHKAKIILFSDDNIRIEFENKVNALKYYEKCQ